jgi:hypothetical protein
MATSLVEPVSLWLRIWTTVAMLLLAVAPVLAQKQNTTVYEAYGGAAYGRSFAEPTANAYGWNVSLAQYPYESHPWVGGKIDASGVFDSRSEPVAEVTLDDSTYAFLAGPVVRMPRARRVRPFAHLLLGTVLERATVTGPDAAVFRPSLQVSQAIFGTALGGGLDLSLTRRLSARAQGDWLTYRENASGRANNPRASAGLVVKF